MYQIFRQLSKVIERTLAKIQFLSNGQYSSHADFRNGNGGSNNFRGRPRPSRYLPNAGIRHTMGALKEDNKMTQFTVEDCDFDEKEYDDMIQKASITYDEYQHEQKMKRKKIDFIKTERKYFRPPQEKNLLTWTAKEQLRYLHETDPELWTPEKLHDSFPISLAGVKKLLKSKFRPQDEDDIAKHDRDVLNNWKQIKSGQGPIATAVGQQLSSQNLNFEALDGNQNLPMPSMEWKNQHKTTFGLKDKIKAIELPLGEFGAILNSYSNLTMPKNLKANNLRSKVPEVQELVPGPMVPIINNNRQHVSIEEFKERMRQSILKFKKSNPDVYEKFTQHINDKGQKPPLPYVKDWDEQPQKRKVPKFKRMSEIESRIKWDTPGVSKNIKHKEAYIYDAQTGYQRPYGRNDETDHIDISESQKVEGAVWKKGNCYYDDCGNLMYRVPFSDVGGKK